MSHDCGLMLPLGSALGEYEVLSVLGQGGFGIVYKGRHRELGIEVAIKEYFPEEISVRGEGDIRPKAEAFASPFEDGLARFLQEAQQLVRFVECPNIVTCRGFFRMNGTAYTVMDYVRGLPLSELLSKREAKEDPLGEQEMLEIMMPLLKGLQKVHEAEVCHRDIKPSNILIRHPDGVPVLIDFGAAKYEISERTKSMAPYTDGYAAWEQVGEGKIGPWTDMYGVGAVMWRMVAGGNPPYLPPNPTSTQKRAFEKMQGNADPLPSAKVIGQGRFSGKVLKAIDACLVIEVEKRVQDCGRLLEMVRKEEMERKQIDINEENVIIEPETTSENNIPSSRKWHPDLIEATKALALLAEHQNCPDLSPSKLGDFFGFRIFRLLPQLLETGVLHKTREKKFRVLIPNTEELDRMIKMGWPDKKVVPENEGEEDVATENENLIVIEAGTKRYLFIFLVVTVILTALAILY